MLAAGRMSGCDPGADADELISTITDSIATFAGSGWVRSMADRGIDVSGSREVYQNQRG